MAEKTGTTQTGTTHGGGTRGTEVGGGKRRGKTRVEDDVVIQDQEIPGKDRCDSEWGK